MFFLVLGLLSAYIVGAIAWHRVLPKNVLTTKGTPAHLFLSYQMVSTSCVLYATYLGWMGAFYDYGTVYEDRLYGWSETSLRLGYMMTGYQAWNFIVCVFIDEYCTFQVLSHHFSTVVLSAMTLAPYVNTYALFFIGIAETSTIPLTIVDSIKCMDLNFPRLMVASKVTFAVLFMVFRVAAWTIVNLLFWYDTISRYPDIPKFGILFCIGSLGLTGLQYYWAKLIMKQIKI
jgi:hypothetical protein